MNKAASILILALLIATSARAQSPDEILSEKGITLPEPSVPVANYVKFVRTGNLIFLSGHGPCGGEFKRGKVTVDLTVEEAYDASRLTAVCLLATLKSAIGDLGKVKRVVRVFGMVNAPADFRDHPQVINGASDLLTEVFGEKGKHVRAAVGMASLPSDIPVEIEMIVEVEE